jgi:serine/threonine protein kinase
MDNLVTAFCSANSYCLGGWRQYRPFSAVYRVKERNGRSLCIKLLHKVDEGVRRNFFREIATLQALEGMYCPKLVKSGSIATMPYHICEWADGQCIQGLLDKRLSLADKIHVMLSVVRTVEELHSRGIIHRDISPDHCFLGGDGKTKLIDFGMARFESDEEKAAARGYFQYDILALGLVFCELLLGQSFFAYRSSAALRRDIPCVLQKFRRSKLPSSLFGIVYRAVSTNSEFEVGLPASKNAYRSTGEFEESLLQIGT